MKLKLHRSYLDCTLQGPKRRGEAHGVPQALQSGGGPAQEADRSRRPDPRQRLLVCGGAGGQARELQLPSVGRRPHPPAPGAEICAS